MEEKVKKNVSDRCHVKVLKIFIILIQVNYKKTTLITELIWPKIDIANSHLANAFNYIIAC